MRDIKQGLKLIKGTVLGSDEIGSILISENLAKAFGYSNPEEIIGQNLNFKFIKGTNNPQLEAEEVSKDKEAHRYYTSLIIKGIASNNTNGGIIFTTNKQFQKLDLELNQGTQFYQKYTSLVVVIKEKLSGDKIKAIKTSLDKLGYTYYDNGDNDDYLRQTIETIEQVQLAAMGLASIGLIAVFFGIINTQLMAVLERIKEVGLIRALGMSKSNIFWLFAIESVMIGFWGSLIGLGITHLISPFINNYIKNSSIMANYDTKLDILIYTPQAWLIVLGVTILTFIAGMFPAIKASNQDPIQTLRYE